MFGLNRVRNRTMIPMPDSNDSKLSEQEEYTVQTPLEYQTVHLLDDLVKTENLENTGDFSRHRQIHNEEKQYECEICSKRFRSGFEMVGSVNNWNAALRTLV